MIKKFKQVGERGRHYALIVLKALMEGYHVKIGDHTWAMNEGGDVGILWDGEHISGCTYLRVGVFISMCNKLEESVVVGLAAAMALKGEPRVKR